MTIFLSLASLLLLTLLSSLLLKKLSQSKWKLPPSPRKLPIIGNLHQIKGTGLLVHQAFHKFAQQYGPIMHLQFGFVPVVVISSSEAAEEVLKTHDLQCCSRPKLLAAQVLSNNYLDMAFTRFGTEWRERRKLTVREIFNLKKVQSFGYAREEANDFLVEKLAEAASKHAPVDINKAFFSLLATIIMRIVFGQNLHAEDKLFDVDKIQDLIYEVEAIVANLTFTDIYPGRIGWAMDWISGQHQKLKRLYEKVDDLLQQVVDDHLKPAAGRRTDGGHRDIIDVMLSLIQDHEGRDSSLSWVTVDHIKSLLSNVLVAGIDTSSITMTWAMAELAKNPKLMKKVQEEIRSRLGKKDKITEEDLGKVDCLKHVIKETFRLHPPGPLLLPRETMADIKIHGYDIPAKTQIHVNAWAIGRDPKIWENPNEFNPDRFINSPVDYKGQHFEFVPFGAGKRMCPGMPMGLATVELGLLNLLYFFDWELPKGMTEKDIDMEEAGGATVMKKTTLELIPLLHQ